MTPELFAAAAMLGGLIAYTLTGGADFGGGAWDLLATGPRARAQRAAIEHAFAPVWEANHVWLIFVIVILFTAFPPAFARIGIELHAPLTILLVGIVLRGSAFVFRQYGGGGGAWGTVFAISSLVAPVFLGVVLGAMTAGTPWWSPFPIAVGALALAVFAYLAAVYLTVEVHEPALREDFRRRALAAAVAVAITAALAAALAHRVAPAFARDLIGAWWTPPVLGGAVLGHLAASLALGRRRFRLARALAIATITLLVLGWGAAHYPLVVAPDLSLAIAAAPAATLRALVPIVIGGALVLVPSLWWLIRVFKSTRPTPDR